MAANMTATTDLINISSDNDVTIENKVTKPLLWSLGISKNLIYQQQNYSFQDGGQYGE